MERKLIVRLKGGLGNQLFCYAAARRLALKNDAELVLDDVTGFKYDHVYKRAYALDCFCITARFATDAERLEPFGRARRLLARKLSERQPLGQRHYIQQVGVGFDPDLLSLHLQEGATYFDGFGQSERYFDDIISVIRQDFEMQAPGDPANQAISAQIAASQAVALHVRWFDAGDNPHSSNISFAYYAQAIERLLDEVGPAHFFIFSDRPEQTASRLKPLMKGLPYSLVQHNSATGNVAADFWLMRQCRHFIIGNSTFAWWGAWLGEQMDGATRVIAPARNVDPGHSVTAWGFPYLLPERWIVL